MINSSPQTKIRSALILGGGSLIGYNAARYLEEQGWRVMAVCTSSSPLVADLVQRNVEVRINPPTPEHVAEFDVVIDAYGETGFYARKDESLKLDSLKYQDVWNEKTIVLSSLMTFLPIRKIDRSRRETHKSYKLREKAAKTKQAIVLRLPNLFVFPDICSLYYPEAVREYILNNRRDLACTAYRSFTNGKEFIYTSHPESRREFIAMDVLSQQLGFTAEGVISGAYTGNSKGNGTYAVFGNVETIQHLVIRSVGFSLKTRVVARARKTDYSVRSK